MTSAAINAVISSADQRHTASEQRRWKGYWTKYWCFRSQRREKRIVPAPRPHGASDSARGWPPVQAGLATAPPSSPASFVNSSVQSPASFTLSLSAASASMCSPGPPNTMFTIGPYAHETQLVSPPVFSTFTTEPSTAPLTPPPELAHLTTSLLPDVPFAQYVASSLNAKAAAREIISPLSTSAMASPCDTPASYTPHSGHLYLDSAARDAISPLFTSTLASPCETPASYTPTSGHLYPRAVRETISPRSSSMFASPCDIPASYTDLRCPVGRLVSSSMEYSSKDTILEEAFPARSYNHATLSFPTYDSSVSPAFNHVPFDTLILPSDSTSRPKDLSAPVVSESLVHKELLTLNDAGETAQNSERELDLRHLQNRMNGSLPLEDNNGCADINGGAPQSEVASSASSVKGDLECNGGRVDSNSGTALSNVASSTYNIDRQKRFQKSCSCEFDENKDPIFLTARNNGDWNLVENAHQIDSHRIEDAGEERLVKSPTALELDASHGIEDAGDDKLASPGSWWLKPLV